MAPLCPSKLYNWKVELFVTSCCTIALIVVSLNIWQTTSNPQAPVKAALDSECVALLVPRLQPELFPKWRILYSQSCFLNARILYSQSRFPNTGILYSQSCQANTHLPSGTGHLRAGGSSRCPRKELCLKNDPKDRFPSLCLQFPPPSTFPVFPT